MPDAGKLAWDWYSDVHAGGCYDFMQTNVLNNAIIDQHLLHEIGSEN